MKFTVMALAALVVSGSALAIPEGPELNTPEWFQREASNYAKTLEAATEQASNPDFEITWQLRSNSNRDDWNARALADPSWVGYPSGNSPDTPAGAQWSSVAASDPTRYPDAEGPNGRSFYENEAEAITVVLYDAGCSRVSAKLWRPRSWKAGDAPLPGVVIQNGSIQASQTMYWWMAQRLVRAGYVVMTFDPRGQGRSDLQTPSGTQGGNVNSDVFFIGMVNTIDFFRSSLVAPYPHNLTCAGTYPTEVTPFNPFFQMIDPERLGIAGHSLGASGISSVQGYAGDTFEFPDSSGGNPVDVLVAWDALALDPDAPPRVPAMGQTSEYFIGGAPKSTPPDPEGHKAAYIGYRDAGVPTFQFTIQGSTHFEWSLIPGFPTTSWCPDMSSGSCLGGWGAPMAEHYTLAWLDRWLKKPGERGYADADARLLDDTGEHGLAKMSFYSRSARSFPTRAGVMQVCEDIRAGCPVTTAPPLAVPPVTAPNTPANDSIAGFGRLGGGGAFGAFGLLLALALRRKFLR